MRSQAWRWIVGAGLLPALCGCPGEDFPNAEPAYAARIETIVENDDLTGPEKRAELEALGLSSGAIDGLLRDEPLANQGGGDLSTAHPKVAGDRFTTLTPDEIQAYAAAVNAADPALGLSFDDQEAALLVRVLVENGLNSSEQLADYLDSPTGVAPESVTDGRAQALLVDADPGDPAIVNQLP